MLIGWIQYFVFLRSFQWHQPIKTDPESVPTRGNHAIGQKPACTTPGQLIKDSLVNNICSLFLIEYLSQIQQNKKEERAKIFGDDTAFHIFLLLL